MLYWKKCVFKGNDKLMKYKYEKCVFSMVLLMLYYKKMCVQNNRETAFSLFSYFYNTKNECLKSGGGLLFSLLS